MSKVSGGNSLKRKSVAWIEKPNNITKKGPFAANAIMENSPEKSVGKEIIPSETGKIGSENDESNVALYPELEKVASIAANATAATQPPSYSQPAQACVYQQTTVSYSRNGHSRNPSAINGITIATQVIQPATLNSKPDAKATLLKFIPFRGDFNDNNDDKRRLCGNREIRCICKEIFRLFCSFFLKFLRSYGVFK